MVLLRGGGEGADSGEVIEAIQLLRLTTALRTMKLSPCLLYTKALKDFHWSLKREK